MNCKYCMEFIANKTKIKPINFDITCKDCRVYELLKEKDLFVNHI